jgi:hypothetical protein
MCLLSKSLVLVLLMYFIATLSDIIYNLIIKSLIYLSEFILSSYVPNQVLLRERKQELDHKTCSFKVQSVLFP